MRQAVSGHVIVAVPVRDEAANLPRFLARLAAQSSLPGMLCIAFDNCTDGSIELVAAQQDDLPFAIVTIELSRAEPNAGRARRAAMETALSHCSDDTILISSDADSLPDHDWIAANLAALEIADVAAGRIIRDGDRPSALQDRVEAYYDALFALRRRIDPVPWEASRTHHYSSGASLAFRASIYSALGGFEALPSAEDARLIDRAHAAGYRVRRDAAIRVITSSRRHGRAEGGLADHLRKLDDGIGDATMAHPADVLWRYEGHAAARAAWPDLARQDVMLGLQIGRSAHDIREIAENAVNAEAFAMRVVPEIPGGERTVSIDVAERELAISATRRATA